MQPRAGKLDLREAYSPDIFESRPGMAEGYCRRLRLVGAAATIGDPPPAYG